MDFFFPGVKVSVTLGDVIAKKAKVMKKTHIELFS